MLCIRLVRASLSEPHIDGTSGRFSIIGASLSEPHTNGTSAARVRYMYIVYTIVRQRGPGGPNSPRAAARRRPRIYIDRRIDMVSSRAAAQAGQ